MVSNAGGIPPSRKRRSQTLRFIRVLKEPKQSGAPASRGTPKSFSEEIRRSNLAKLIPAFVNLGNRPGDISFKIDPESGAIKKILKTTEGADLILRVSQRRISKMEMLRALLNNEGLVAFFEGIVDHINEKASA